MKRTLRLNVSEQIEGENSHQKNFMNSVKYMESKENSLLPKHPSKMG